MFILDKYLTRTRLLLDWDDGRLFVPTTWGI